MLLCVNRIPNNPITFYQATYRLSPTVLPAFHT